MANVFTVQTLQDGPRNVILNVEGVLDTSNLAVTDVVDPTTLNPVATALRIDQVDYSITDQLGVQLLWDATADVTALALAGRGNNTYQKEGGLQNNAGAGKTGKIQIVTTGWASGTQTFSLKLWLVKQGVTNWTS